MAKEVKKQGMEPKKIDYSSELEVQKALVENFILMQKVLSNLTVKFDDMSNQLNKFLQLMEISAKNFVEKTNRGELGRENFQQRGMQNFNQNRTQNMPPQNFMESQFQPSLEPSQQMFQPPRPVGVPSPSNMQPTEEQQEY